MSEATPAVTGGPPPLAALPGDALLPGARIAEFEIRSVLGAGGFGIVYLAWDHALEREVALKEYMPASLAGRAADGRVCVRAASQAETFSLGLKSFVNEARLLARFDHPSLVKVYRFWEDNGTAYMAMPMVRGRTLRQVRQDMPPGSPGEAWCRALLEPLLGALECMHAEEVYHRDIAPDNILIADDGRPVLLDFGAARRVINDRSHAVTAIVKPNFAPIEQYADVAAVRQGPWTDLYALAATTYYLLTGQPPLPAAARALHDELPRLAQLKPEDCSEAFLEAVDWALAVRPQERPQSVVLWRDVLEGRMAVPRAVRPDVTRPDVSARLPERLPAAHRTDFDPTQPWPSGKPLPMAGIEDGPSTLPADVLPEPAAAQPAAARPLRRLPWIGASALVVAVVGLMAWRSTVPGDGPATASSAGPAASSPVAAASAPAAPPSVQPAVVPPAPVVARAAEPVEFVAASVPARPLPASAAMPGATPPAAAPPAREPRERRREARERESAPRAAAILGPRERCADRNFLTRLVCMKQACDGDARLAAHPECVRMRQAEQERRDVMFNR